MKKIGGIIAFLTFTGLAWAQSGPFSIALQEMTIEGLPGAQSYVFGQANGKWLIIGGRTDGLHRRQPWAAFDLAGHNTTIIVVDPATKQYWTASLNALPTPIMEQLRSTNMEFFQEGDYLYCIGGYGYSAAAGDHVTFPNLTAVDVPGVIDAIINGQSITPYFRQITDTMFQVTGGRVRKMHDKYYLMGGQKFMGRYNPMGPNHGPGFVQQYTDAIRIFSLSDDGTNISVTHYPAWVHSVHLHRRDYNAEAQILPNGEEGLVMFAGVFRHDSDLPFTYLINIDSGGWSVVPNFDQYYHHYHCPTIPIYSASANEMHTLFFGGIARYYDSAGILVQDDNVPFVSTISRITRHANGSWGEYKLPIEMPGLLGASAEFIPHPDVPRYPNEVIKFDDLPNDSVLLGYIYGGIESSARNIFWINDGTQSSATNRIFKVYLIKGPTSGTDRLNPAAADPFRPLIFSDAEAGAIRIRLDLPQRDRVTVTFQDLQGKILQSSTHVVPGGAPHTFTVPIPPYAQGIYLITVETRYGRHTRKFIPAR